MDVITGVPDGDPANRVVFLAPSGQAGAVHDLGGRVRPFLVAEHPVTRSCPGHAMPHRTIGSACAQGRDRLLQQAVEPAEVPGSSWSQRWFELSGVPPSGDDMRVGVLLTPAGPV